MRHLFLLLVIVSCKAKPAAPDPKQFAAMSEDAKCEATVARTSDCMSEVLARQIESLQKAGSDEGLGALANDLRGDKAPSDEAAAMHRITCQASKTYAEAVFVCWAKPDCKSFAACVVEKDVGGPRRP